MLFAAFALYIAAIALWLHRAQAAPYLLYGGVFAQTVLAFLAVIVLSRDQPDVVYAVPVRNNAPQATFVETKTTWQIAILGPLLILVGIPALLWVQDRLRAMYYPALTRWLIWPMLVGAFLINAAILIIVQVFDLPLQAYATLTIVQSTGYQALLLAIAAIVVLALVSFIRRLRDTGRKN